MKNKCKILILALALAAAFTVFTGCSKGLNQEDIIIDRGMTVKVTFDLAGGKSSDSEIRYIRLSPGTPLALPWDHHTSIHPPVKSGYMIEGWYTGTKDGDGNIAYGERIEVGTPMYESVTLYAKWQPRMCYNILDIATGGSVLKVYCAENATLDVTRIKYAGYTLIDVYKTAEKEPWDPEFRHPGLPDGLTPDTAEEEDYEVNVYGYFLQGDWVKVVTAQDFLTSGALNFYLVGDDSGEIDCSALTRWWTHKMAFSGKIIGNGVTVKNLTVERKDIDFSRNLTTVGLGIFGTTLNGAQFSDMTFKDCNFNVTYTKGIVNNNIMNIGFLGGVAQDTAVNDVSFENCAVNINIKRGTDKPVVTVAYESRTDVAPVWNNRDKDADNGNTATATGNIVVNYIEN